MHVWPYIRSKHKRDQCTLVHSRSTAVQQRRRPSCTATRASSHLAGPIDGAQGVHAAGTRGRCSERWFGASDASGRDARARPHNGSSGAAHVGKTESCASDSIRDQCQRSCGLCPRRRVCRRNCPDIRVKRLTILDAQSGAPPEDERHARYCIDGSRMSPSMMRFAESPFFGLFWGSAIRFTATWTLFLRNVSSSEATPHHGCGM